MFRAAIIKNSRKFVNNFIYGRSLCSTNIDLPQSAEVVIIGGGSAGCHTFYHLATRGVKALLLERSKLTSGTTWHTAGLIWSFRMSDIDMHLLASSRNLLRSLENDVGIDPGWIENGTLFIAHTKNRLDEYCRMAALGSVINVDNEILSAEDCLKYFPLLNKNTFMGALYSPGDGVIDPAMLCTALTRAGTALGARVIENCPVEEILIEDSNGHHNVTGIRTPYGDIKCKVVVNAAGAWGNNLICKYGINLPLVPMRHAYVVSESIKGVRGLPNIRDHDLSIYFRIQGDSICLGGYENNPIIEKELPSDFQFSLYDIDWSVFDQFIKGAVDLCPTFGQHGIKSTICGPESFTPDHRPIMGPDPILFGLYHNFGFNSSGMMFGGGCANQIANWICNGQPDIAMHQYDVRRFTPRQCHDNEWIRERSHESYVKNYNQVFPHAQKLSGRNMIKGPLHDDLIENGAFMEEQFGWERPGFFLKNKVFQVPQYDWYGCYGHKKNQDQQYWEMLKGDLKYSFSDHFDVIKNEALMCRESAVVFDLSSQPKFYLSGNDVNELVEWLYTNDIINQEYGK